MKSHQSEGASERGREREGERERGREREGEWREGEKERESQNMSKLMKCKNRDNPLSRLVIAKKFAYQIASGRERPQVWPRPWTVEESHSPLVLPKI